MIFRRVQLGRWGLSCWVATTADEHRLGLQLFDDNLAEHRALYLPYVPPQHVTIVMGMVSFPIDIVFLRDGRVARIVRSVPPLHSGQWSLSDCSGVLELRGGWSHRHYLQLGTPLYD